MKWIILSIVALTIAFSEEIFAAEPVKSNLDQEVECLAQNMYWESRNQSFRGLLAVGNVVMNRMADPRFPNTACEVVHQAVMIKSWKTGEYIPKRNQCHFSWYCDGKAEVIPAADKQLYELTRSMAFKVYTGWFEDITEGATHYHAYYVRPDWAETKTPTVRVDAHIFYRWEKQMYDLDGEKAPDYKFEEDIYVDELLEYISNTYDTHYSKNNFQATEFIIDGGHGEGFCIGNILKYAQRYGKKGSRQDARKDLMKVLHYAIIQLYVHDNFSQDDRS